MVLQKFTHNNILSRQHDVKTFFTSAKEYFFFKNIATSTYFLEALTLNKMGKKMGKRNWLPFTVYFTIEWYTENIPVYSVQMVYIVCGTYIKRSKNSYALEIGRKGALSIVKEGLSSNGVWTEDKAQTILNNIRLEWSDLVLCRICPMRNFTQIGSQ